MYKDGDYLYDEIKPVAKNATLLRLLNHTLKAYAKNLDKKPIPVSIDCNKKRCEGDLLFDKNYNEIYRQYIKAIDSGATEWVV